MLQVSVGEVNEATKERKLIVEMAYASIQAKHH